MRRKNPSSVEEEAYLAETEKTRLKRPAARTARVLLVEDDVEMRNLLAWGLGADGYDVVEAKNGLEFYEHLMSSIRFPPAEGRDPNFDLIVSDIRLPGLTGLEVLASIRQHDKLTPVILITAFGDEDTHAEAKQLGASAVIDKPFDINHMRTVIRSMVSPRIPRV